MFTIFVEGPDEAPQLQRKIELFSFSFASFDVLFFPFSTLVFVLSSCVRIIVGYPVGAYFVEDF